MRIEKLDLKKLNNTRDLGGFPAADGKVIKKGKLIRSGKLYKLPKSTRDALKRAGVTSVIDLRTDKEREEYPFTAIDGANYYHIPLVCTATTGITHQKSMAATMMKESKRIKSEFGTADKYMESMYAIILFSEESKERLKEILRLILENEGCILWHCNGGKDRTGIVAMLVEELLGVDEELIIKDYIASDKFQRRRRNIQKAGLHVIPLPRRFKKILFALMNAKPQYIKGAIDEIKQRYGTVENYCKVELGLTDGDVEALKEKYLA